MKVGGIAPELSTEQKAVVLACAISIGKIKIKIKKGIAPGMSQQGGPLCWHAPFLWVTQKCERIFGYCKVNPICE